MAERSGLEEQETRELREEVKRLREQLERREPPKSEPQHEEGESEEPPRPSLRRRLGGWISRNPISFLALLVVLAVLVVGGLFLWRYLNSYESTDDAQVDGNISAVSTRVGGIIQKVYVEDNQPVKQGQLLVEIDPRDYQVAMERSQADLEQARAAVTAEQTNLPLTVTSTQTNISTTEADVNAARAGVAAAQKELDAALARVRQAEANNIRAQADVTRYRQLVEKDEISREVYDQKVAAAKAAAAEVEANQALAASAQRGVDEANARLQQAQSRQAEARQSAPEQRAQRQAAVRTRQAAVAASLAAVNQANLNLGYTRIFAPVDGVVGRKNANVGEHVAPGQELMAIVQLNDLWVTANYKETQIKRMHPNQRVTIGIDAYGHDLEGYVESLPGASGARYSLLPPENATGNYVKVVQRLPVRIRFKPNHDAIRSLRPGMSVEPKVWLD